MKYVMVVLTLFYSCLLFGQSYTSYFTGHSNDTAVVAQGGICMMGGASEHDEAMKWFLGRCSGGDVLVLRASGSNGYNAYMYNQLGITLNSVETIVCHSANASDEQYIHQKIQQAEGIWFAGGDQWDYISYWRNTPIDSLINAAITERNIVIGGTSAGMAILGGFYFTAKNGTVTSAAALSNPYTNKVTLDSTSFLKVPFLHDIITDTHYDNPDRKGRQIAFLARILTDWGVEAKGIACDEYTAVCIGSDGLAHVYGDYPSSDDNAWFIQTNCELDPNTPEQCTTGMPLHWDLNGTALKVYNVKGTETGSNTFNLNDWSKGTGGDWHSWHISNGVLGTSESDRIHCATIAVENIGLHPDKLNVYPNPYYSGPLRVAYEDASPDVIRLSDAQGRLVLINNHPAAHETMMDPPTLFPGLYFLTVVFKAGMVTNRIVVY